jgi:hypothetical protein
MKAQAADYKVLVLDIGKTNKKLFVYDSRLRCLNPEEPGAQFPLIMREGLACDDMEAIHRWMMDGLRHAAAQHQDIGAISISTHGATIALLGCRKDGIFSGDGGLVFPIVSYTHDIGEAAEEAFFQDIGLSPEECQRQTATARFGWLINHGKQIHYLQRRMPERFAEVTDILMFPQYVGYLLTGRKGIEPTYIGCHGYLLDASGARYSLVAERLGIADKLPPLPAGKTWDVLGTITPDVAAATGLRPDCLVTMGVHDSNAALVPYFAKRGRTPSPAKDRRERGQLAPADFVVQDSGTWIVTMAPCARAEFAAGELGKEVFFNWSIYGTPVKTTIFRGGAEFDFFRQRVLDGKPRPSGVDEGVLREVAEKREAFSLPTIERGSGLYPKSIARLEGLDTIFRDPVTAWHVVDLGLAVQGYHAIAMAAGQNPREVYIEGNVGRNNPVYRRVVSSLFPQAKVSFGSLGGAPFGAAILGVAAVEGVRPEDLAGRFEMRLEEVPKLALPAGALQEYVRAFVSRLG